MQSFSSSTNEKSCLFIPLYIFLPIGFIVQGLCSRNLQSFPPYPIPMDDGVKKEISVYSSLFLALCYCYFISSRISIGFFRLISLLPILYLFAVLPLYLPYVFFTAILAFFITWLANFKLILFAFGQGPLSSDESLKSLRVFITSAALPIRMKPNNYPSSQSEQYKATKKIPIINNLGTEFLTSAILIAIMVEYKDKLHPRVLLLAYCCLVFLFVDCLVASSSFLVRSLVGLELEPPSDEPYLSTSLQEFWGKRWNLTVTNTLRQTVYKPVRSASSAVLGAELAPLPAVLAAFLVSGLMHELLCYYMTRAKPSWEMTSFFVLHGICVVLEFGIKKALNGRLNLPWFVSGPLTVGFVVATSFWLFFPPLVRNGADAVVFEEFRCFGERVRNGMLTRIGGFVGFLR